MDKNKIHIFKENYKIKGFNELKKSTANNVRKRSLLKRINGTDNLSQQNKDNDETNLFIKLLEAREERVELINKLNREFGKTIICIRANYPGLYKTNDRTITIVEELEKELKYEFNSSMIYNLNKRTFEGPIALLVLDEDSAKVKKDTIDIEEKHPLGRLVDIDVYDNEGNGISRDMIGLPRRKCFICENEAHVCVRNKTHKMEEVKEYINKTLEEFISK
jgi:holo-ACP synthase